MVTMCGRIQNLGWVQLESTSRIMTPWISNASSGYGLTYEIWIDGGLSPVAWGPSGFWNLPLGEECFALWWPWPTLLVELASRAILYKHRKIFQCQGSLQAISRWHYLWAKGLEVVYHQYLRIDKFVGPASCVAQDIITMLHWITARSSRTSLWETFR